jgi:hypothetical protein
MPHHRRIVLSIPHGADSRALVRHAAELARALRLELHGVFVEDEAVHGLSALPFVRELRLPTHEWHPIDAETVTIDFRQAAQRAKQWLDTAARTMGVRADFQVQRGNPEGVVASLLCSSDIVVLTEHDTLTQSFLRAWKTACGSAASVLLLPPGRMRQRGPVVALGAHERATQTAAHIAALTHETLLLLGTASQAPSGDVQQRPLTDVTETALAFSLRDTMERLLVIDRDALDQDREATILRFAAARGTPVLLVGQPPDI